MLVGDSEAVDQPVSGRVAGDRPQLQATLIAEPGAVQDAAADRRVAGHLLRGLAGSAITCSLPASGSAWSWFGTGCRSWRILTRPPAFRCARPRRSGMRSLHRASWFTWTSRSRAASPTAVIGAPTVGDQPETVAVAVLVTRPPEQARSAHVATGISITPSTTTHASRTRRSWTTGARRPRPGSALARTRSSPAAASPLWR